MVIASPWTNLFNRCIETGTYPDAFKIAEVIPVYKSGDKFTCSNFRPISLISPLSKIFEKCSYKQLYHYFTSRDILYKHQHGFRENNSTESAVSQMCESIIENLENKNTTCAIYINDLPKVSNLKVRLFADNAILPLSDKDEKHLQHIMNDQLTKIDDWMKINQLTINYKKTNFIIFTRK